MPNEQCDFSQQCVKDVLGWRGGWVGGVSVEQTLSHKGAQATRGPALQ